MVRICTRLDGIPLALELAAARIGTLPVGKIAERLDDRFRLLSGGAVTGLPRQQTLRAMVDWSFDLLSDAEKSLFARLSVFAGGFTLEAAENVCATGVAVQSDVLDRLSSLVQKSLVTFDAGCGSLSNAGDDRRIRARPPRGKRRGADGPPPAPRRLRGDG